MCQARPYARAFPRVSITNLPLVFLRNKSIRASIERGIRQSQEISTYRQPRRRAERRSRTIFQAPLLSSNRLISPRSLEERTKEDELAQETTGNPLSEERSLDSTRESRQIARLKRHVPDTLPYSTAASEFLYGYSVVLAALKAGRRQLYNLYIHTRGQNHASNAAILSRAKYQGVKIHEVGDEWLHLMDRASSGRPHNGFILESSPLPRPPITELAISSVADGFFIVKLDRQSREDSLVNGQQTKYTYKSNGWRHPLLLYVDGVLDEGNLGAIARSAYFLGVDAIATPTRQTAPWSHIALKASAGAAEAIPIFTVTKPSDFLLKSGQGGWRIYATDAIPREETTLQFHLSSSSTPKDTSSDIVFTYARSRKRLLDHHPVAMYPTILMMGAEGTGLRSSLLNQAHFNVGVRAGRDVDQIGVDSLNVSVAASLLCYEFLKKPKKERKPGDWLF
ncbi:alpha/beta knot [Lojkania enalia]|uniref:rRNA methyltransferase 1, mitochondrial n=1 Tax=Lojkania enalia TaxID=147567 RepID=A0A9P4JVP4_9PLEO|nr:alpha/beta knot [Didymosphaeria enalia]